MENTAHDPPTPEDDRKASEKSSLPLRVRAGAFHDDHFAIETSQEVFEIPWDKVTLLTMGIIEEDVADVDGPRSGMRNFVRKMFFGEDSGQNAVKKQVREVYLLDLYVERMDTPFRIESTSINYRRLLPEAGYVSFQNFLSLAQLIAGRCRMSRFDCSCFDFLGGRRDQVRRYASVYDFDLESHTARAHLKDQRLRGDLYPGEKSRVAEEQAAAGVAPGGDRDAAGAGTVKLEPGAAGAEAPGEETPRGRAAPDVAPAGDRPEADVSSVEGRPDPAEASSGEGDAAHE